MEPTQLELRDLKHSIPFLQRLASSGRGMQLKSIYVDASENPIKGSRAMVLGCTMGCFNLDSVELDQVGVEVLTGLQAANLKELHACFVDRPRVYFPCWNRLEELSAYNITWKTFDAVGCH